MKQGSKDSQLPQDRRAHRHSVFLRYLLSFTILTALATGALGYLSHRLFRQEYWIQMEHARNQLGEYVGGTLDGQIFRPVHQLYFSIAGSAGAGERIHTIARGEQPPGAADLLRAHRELVSLLLPYRHIVSDIRVVLPDQRVALSAIHGVRYLDGRSDISPEALLDHELPKSGTAGWVFHEAQVNLLGRAPSDRAALTYVGKLPFTSTASLRAGFVAADVNVDTVLRELRVVGGTAVPFALVFEDRILGTNGVEPLPTTATRTGRVEFMETAYAASERPLVPSGLSVVSIAPMELYNHASLGAARRLALLAILVVLAAWLCGALLSRHLYRPVAILVEHARAALSGSLEGSPGDEFALLDRALSSLNMRVEELEDSVRENRGLIKHQLLARLMISGLDESFGVHGELLGLPENPDGYIPLALEIRLSDQTVPSPIRLQAIRYALIDGIERLADRDWSVVATELDDGPIAALAIRHRGAGVPHDEFVARVGAVAGHARGAATVGIGRVCTARTEIAGAYRDAVAALDRRFLHPNRAVFHAASGPNEEMLFPQALLESFGHAVRGGKRNDVVSALDDIVEALRNDQISPRQARQIITQLAHTVASLSVDLGLHDEFRVDGILADARAIENINRFHVWMIGLCNDLFNRMQARRSSRTQHTVQEIEAYICDHMGEQLSLTSVADEFGISSRYVSRIFKRQSGMNFVSYVTSVRIAAAHDLLANPDLTVAEIGAKVGFQTPAYFIRKFREQYGDTPANFRRRRLLEASMTKRTS